MLDIEILRLDFFRSEKYQDFFRFMDSVGLSTQKVLFECSKQVASGCIDGATIRSGHLFSII